MPIEQYRLVLFHELITEDGKSQRLDDPLIVKYMMSGDSPKLLIVSEMMDKMKNFLLDHLAELRSE